MSYDDHHHPTPWGPQDWGHGAPHNSWAPIIMSFGIAVFLFSLASVFEWGEFIGWGYVPVILLGMVITLVGLVVWWRQDYSFDGSYEPRATGAPFQNIEIRKVAMWVFLMSEMMVFTSLFSTYIRYRLGITPCKEVFESGDWVEGTAVTCFEPASHLIASSWFHLAPGAINTFALIISSFTIVQALRYAKMSDDALSRKFGKRVDAAVIRRRKVTRYLGTTWFLAVLFLTMKMIEWFLGFPLPGFLAEFNHGHDTIQSLYSEGYLINAENYQHHDYNTEHHHVEGHSDHAQMMANIQVSATTFYVTTGTHGAHVFGGIIGLTYMTLKASTGGYTPENAVSIEYFGLYWHFVDLVWVLVFPFFYLF
ncbi:MAG: cytochrome c oxidase subunit 3 [Candidatus Thalassarchaeaceae archaeon]|nr:cytochrome c oxidase subunit 3 [Candidatus Thalassarchaeaceae archaeon]